MYLNQILFDFCIREVLNLIQTNDNEISTTNEADKLQMIEENVTFEKNVMIKDNMMIKENITVNVSQLIKMISMNQYQLTHINAKDTIVFTAMKMKNYYNQRHKVKFF